MKNPLTSPHLTTTLTLTPLETAIDRDIAVTLVVANNAQWGMIKNQQKEMWGREAGTSLRDVDYYKIFEAAGAYSTLVLDPNDLPSAIQKSWAKNKPSFIEVKTSSDPSLMTKGLVEMRVRTAIE